ncbi:ATP-dependent nuclease [Leucobacter chinensis]|uniref:ATP-dependent nuclease n=1 Tax=Leucobacter chinensis TaxID=2851010 RepID=UPI001C223EA5|nr:AAA family ATPase [Leucobacter chinensis]
MSNRISLKQVVLRSGDTVEVSDGVTAIVGPNNTGKSSLLREVRDYLSSEPYHLEALSRKVIDRAVLVFEGSPDDYFNDLVAAYGRREPGHYNYGMVMNPHVVFNGSAYVELTDLQQLWSTGTSLGGRLSQFQLRYLNAEERLGLTNNAPAINTYNELPSMPLQILFSKRELEQRLNDLSSEAFKTGVVVNRYAGGSINLHAGRVAAEEGPSPQSAEYQAEINSLPLMHDQGDGMRAFVGMVMSIITSQTPLVLIDEPEAFLHPPQARMFGRFLADFAKQGTGVQVIIATHSEDVIAGLTSTVSGDTRISIARLTRDQDRNHVAQLPASAVRELYEDPLMKHYDMLNGLFSTGVVLCEADSDCTYYRATVDELPSDEYGYIQEAHFTHSSGKARIAQAIKTFKQTAVPVVAIFDIDILQNDNEFWRLVEVVGGDRSVIEPLRNIVVNAVGGRSESPSRTAVKAQILEILEGKNVSTLSGGEVGRIQGIISRKSGWKEFKNSGRSMLSGGAAQAFISLTGQLETLGVFVLEQGELERLHSSVGQSNKAAWLREVIEDGLYRDSPAAPLLKRVSEYLGQAQTQTVAEGEETAIDA